MSIYWQNKVKLQEAMTMDLKQTIRVWLISGLHIDVEGIPENIISVQTIVIKSSENNNLAVAVQWTTKEDRNFTVENIGPFYLPLPEEHLSYTKVVARISTLEELNDKFPQLFEMEGSLFALR